MMENDTGQGERTMAVPVLITTSIVFVFLASPTIPTKPGAQPSGPADLKITIRQTLGTQYFDTTEYLSGRFSRREMQPLTGAVPKHRRAIVTQRGTDRVQVFDLDLDAREYVAYETTLQGTSLSSKPQRLQPSGATVQLFSDSVDTGERKEIFGQLARHIITKVRQVASPGACSSNSESETDGWYIGYEALPEWRRPRAGVYHVISGACGDKFDKFEVQRSGPFPGYPLATTTTTLNETRLVDGSNKEFTSSSKMEVLEFTQAPLDPALFQVPAGFRKVHRLADQKTAYTPGLQGVWQRLKDTWDDLVN
jgi:hypothetical protein